MAAKPIPPFHPVTPGSPYCSDPNCKSCNDLRLAQQQIKNGSPSPAQSEGLIFVVQTCGKELFAVGNCPYGGGQVSIEPCGLGD